jgi:hypothetical protein
MKSGMAAPNGVRESERSGHAFVQGGIDLQEFTKNLTDIRGQLVLGLRRVEESLHMLEMRMGRVGNAGELGFGGNTTRNKEKMGFKRRNVGVGWSKPKKKNFRGKLTQPGLLGPKPSKESSLTFQGPSPMNSFHYRDISRCPVQQLRQVGESSVTGAARTTGDNGLTIAGDISGVHSFGVEDPCLVTVVMNLESESDGDLIDGLGRGKEAPLQRLGSITEDAEDLGSPFSSPEKCSKVSESWRSLLSTIPESDAALGHATSLPVKSSNRLPEPLECAGEVGFNSLTPDKQPMQVKVFQRRVSLSSKTTKSWVAERVSWNGSRGCDVTTIVSSGKNLISYLDSEKHSSNAFSVLGEHEEQGMLGGMGNQENETPGVEGTNSQLVGKFVTEEQLDQGKGSDSPGSKVLNLVWKVKGIAGMSWDGKEGNLKQVFGQIVADKYGEGTSSLGEEVDGIMGMRDVDIPYEA